MSEAEDFLEHFGVKGMHWGIRKKRQAGSEDHAIAAELRKKQLHELNNAELRRLVERQGLEQNFHRLNPSGATQAKVAAAGVVGTATLAVTAFNIIKSPLGQLTVTAGKKFLENGGLLVKGLKFVN